MNSLVSECEDMTGGVLLSKICSLSNSATDNQTIEFYRNLLNKSFVPFIEMLEKWIY